MINSLTNTINIGKNIKHYRKLEGLTQKEFGAKIHKSEISIRKYESGKGNIPMSTFFDIARSFNINIVDLLRNEEGRILGIEKDIYEDLRKFATNVSTSNYLEQYIKTLGYEIDGDESEGYLVINAPGGTYEITEKDIEEFTTTTKAFVLFKLQEILKNSRKIDK
ncbi:helix-turn-helix domain-containing protein [Clostridium botulinum]|uniref:helix-turn-helix domain-containing protein n=1 Tax=Clostridium botulinum TaxID=1491 RepID=UPI0001AAD709|nr:helix-turn-helix transcriptional regulator [Clostridium botulinum]EES49696.1 helix-turn-helix domain protein [Clostridium botulinum E1 str. 'BoNT E Beluga']MBY6761457.1 helix-turn-helix transcriptional regulator [Clostridium botulinum]MBY6920211.1 helix-turn-helix transcriptional regulator [Clostridium botulinum]MCR1131102.1 helix-turn-helix domain-containing protein [Clostridium botulinum]HBZ6636330.1 helix-turn-helix transcriptional regulator [Clostridium botulinum]